jgi:hypothetical protein
MPSLKQLLPAWANTYSEGLIGRYRQVTWQRRPLPDFIIIGAQKSGTTSLHSYLVQHPDIVSSFRKEVHFFDGGLDPEIDNYRHGEAWYRAQFPIVPKGAGYRKTFEASPLYIFNPPAPARIFNLVPEAKIIAILRNPSERAISHYFNQRRRGGEYLPILDALKQEETRLAPAWERQDYKDASFIRHSYKARGLYKEQLERYFRLFRREQLLVIDSKDLFRDTITTLDRIFAFIGVSTNHALRDTSPKHVAKNKHELAPEIRPYLDSFFQAHNEALYDLIGEDFGW